MLEQVRCKPRYRSAYLPIWETRVHAYVSDAGDERPTVMFVHGYMAHSMAFRRIVAAFSNQYNVYVIDLPSHGRDPSFLEADAEPNMVWARRWLHAVLDVVQPDHLVGHSLGATLAYDVAEERSDLKTLTLVDPGLWLTKRPLDAFALGAIPPMIARLAANDVTLRIFERFQWRGPSMSKQERRAYLGPMKDPRRLQFMLRWGKDLLKSTDPDRKLEPVSAKTLILWGQNDGLFPAEDAPKMAKALDAECHIFEGAGHAPPEDTPEAFSKVLLSFLEADS